MRIRILDGAQDDLDANARRLEREQPGFGSAFFALYRAARTAIRTSTRQHSPTEDGPEGIETREVFIGRFNHRVIYAVTETEVVILAVQHAHRRPRLVGWPPRGDPMGRMSVVSQHSEK